MNAHRRHSHYFLKGTLSLFFIFIILFIFGTDIAFAKRPKSVHLLTTERVKLAEITSVDEKQKIILLREGTSTVIVGYYSLKTLFYLGTGELTTEDILKTGNLVYIFSSSRNMAYTADVDKVILKNKSKLSRDTEKSRASIFLSRLFDDSNSNGD